MELIGLTGGVGMGKSTVADYLARRGEVLVDTDVLARELVRPGESALAEIRQAFGEGVLNSAGELDRRALATLVFRDAEARQRLEAILHPRIRAGWKGQADEWRDRKLKRGIVVIPLLYETGAQGEFDRIICVACSERVQRVRLRERGWNDEEIRSRDGAQWAVGRKIDLADGVIWNEWSREMCEEQCARLFPR